MTHLIGRILMTLAIIQYSIVPIFVDLGSTTHVHHPGWLPHARMHTVWLLALTLQIGLFALYLLWIDQSKNTVRLHLSGALSFGVFLAFFVAAGTAPLYGGAMSDEGGVPTGPLGIDANIFGFSVATGLLLVGWCLVARGRRTKA